jgi:hypothetical protein
MTEDMHTAAPDLPAISLGLWQNFGDDRALDTQRAIVRRAFDLGITHFDLANNYGPPYGSAESNFGRILARPAQLPRRADHLDQGRLRHVAGAVRRTGDRASTCWPASTRASPGWASTTSTSSTRIASIPRRRSRRRWARSIRRSGRARRSTSASPRTRRSGRARRRRSCASLGTPLLIHQPSYSMLNRWIEAELLDVLARGGDRLRSPSRRWRRACSPTATSRACRRGSRARIARRWLQARCFGDNLVGGWDPSDHRCPERNDPEVGHMGALAEPRLPRALDRGPLWQHRELDGDRWGPVAAGLAAGQLAPGGSRPDGGHVAGGAAGTAGRSPCRCLRSSAAPDRDPAVPGRRECDRGRVGACRPDDTGPAARVDLPGAAQAAESPPQPGRR